MVARAIAPPTESSDQRATVNATDGDRLTCPCASAAVTVHRYDTPRVSESIDTSIVVSPSVAAEATGTPSGRATSTV